LNGIFFIASNFLRRFFLSITFKQVPVKLRNYTLTQAANQDLALLRRMEHHVFSVTFVASTLCATKLLNKIPPSSGTVHLQIKMASM
jgi:hypothetical protein